MINWLKKIIIKFFKKKYKDKPDNSNYPLW